MEIKDIYLDLREGPQYAKNQNNVWLLESEMFKDPLKLNIVYDDWDKKYIEDIKKECLKVKEDLNKEYEKVNKIIEEQTKILNDLKQYKVEEQRIIDWYKEMQNEEKQKRKEIKQNQKEKEKNDEEVNNKIKDLYSLIKKKPPQRIFRYTGSELISWLDPYYWEDIEIPSWDYQIIEKIHYEPQNERCLNQDTEIFYTKHISDVYNPMIQLIGENGIDKPVAKVEIDILFFQL